MSAGPITLAVNVASNFLLQVRVLAGDAGVVSRGRRDARIPKETWCAAAASMDCSSVTSSGALDSVPLTPEAWISARAALPFSGGAAGHDDMVDWSG